jgi:hypothetical protein
MEILALKLFVNEAEANDLVKKHLPDSGAIENLRVRLTPEGVVVQGEYPAFMMKVTFETLWELSVAGPEVVAHLASARVAGLPAGILKGAMLKMIRDAVAQGAGVRVGEDAVRVHAEEAARAFGVPLKVRFIAVRCSLASLVIEAGA